MPPPSPRPSGRGVALLSSVPAPYPPSPERLPIPASPWFCLPPPWDPAQLPSPHCVPSTNGLCVSLALVRPATACLRVSPAPACPALGCLLPAVCLSHPRLVPSLQPFLPLSVGHSISAAVPPSFPPSIRPSAHLFLCFSPPSSLHLCTDSVSVSVASPTPSLSVCFTSFCFMSPPLSLQLVSPPPCVSAPSSPPSLLLRSAGPGDRPPPPGDPLPRPV